MYEHLNHKAYGFEVAHNKSIILASHAVLGECQHLQVAATSQYVALIPFYGGLPPNVTKDLSVKSIGQGNSLVSASQSRLYMFSTPSVVVYDLLLTFAFNLLIVGGCLDKGLADLGYHVFLLEVLW